MKRGVGSLGIVWLTAGMAACGGATVAQETVDDTAVEAAPATLPAESRDARFERAGLTLEGTLELPERAAEARVPAIVLVHGSGPQSRDATVQGQLAMSFGFELPVFAQLSRGLVEAGFAVLRYDKRTCSRFNGCENDYPAPDPALTAEDFVLDAVAAAGHLRTLSEIDPERVVVLGHSQGGALVPVILDRDPQISAGVMVAAPHRPIDRMLADQRDFVAELAGSTAGLDGLSATVSQLERLRAGEHDGTPIGGAPVVFWLSAFALDDEGRELARTLDRPLLALGGGYDWNVPAVHLEGWQEAFASAPGRRETRTLECVTHVLNCVTQPDYRQITPADIGREVHPPVIEAVVTFLASL